MDKMEFDIFIMKLNFVKKSNFRLQYLLPSIPTATGNLYDKGK